MKGPSLDNIEAIIFDLGGVILNLNYQLTIDRFKEMGEEKFNELYSQASQDKIFDAFELGDMSSDHFINYLSKFLPETISNVEIVEAWNLMLLDLPKERLDLLKDLKSQFKLYLFSNTNDLHFTAFSEYFVKNFEDANLLDKYFIKTYYSHMVGKRKPNHDAFNLVLDENSLKPENVLFIDDSIQHIEGAKSVGIQTFHLVGTDVLTIFK